MALLSFNFEHYSILNPKSYIPVKLSLKTDGFVTFACYFLLLNTMLPVSLFVNMEVIKLIQGKFIDCDIKIYDTKNNIPAKVSSCGLVEELGQINYLFTDKTGTLT